MATMREIAAAQTDGNFAKIYGIVADRLQSVQFTADGIPLSGVSHTVDDLVTIRSAQYDSVCANTVRVYGGYETVETLEQSVKADIRKLTVDGFENPVTAFGTQFDPSSYNSASLPTLISPEQGAAVYANGGLAKIIIDKKSKGSLLNGFDVQSKLFEQQQLTDLKEYASSLNFAQVVCDAARDALLYGGSVAYPVLFSDNPVSFGMTVPQLLADKRLVKNSIAYFVTADRWNTVIVPDYNITASDYFNPRVMYMPMAGYSVHRDRFARCIVNRQPYWAALSQIGWGTSDLVSYLRALMGYELMAISIPVMCQQMSLLVHELPLDGIIAQNGVKAAKQWQHENEKELRDWSILNPKAINSFGKFVTVDRTYAGFDNLIDAIRKDVSAKSGIPESVLFYTQQTGIFSKSEEDVMLKQSETIRLVQRELSPQLSKMLPFIAASLWGCPDLDTWQKYSTLQVSFDTPVVSSPSQKAEIGFKYASTIKVLVDSGLDVRKALGVASKMIGEVELPEDFEDVLKTTPEAPLTPEPLDEDETDTAQGAADGQA